MTDLPLDVVDAPDGSVVVTAHRVATLGAAPGDHLRIAPIPSRQRRSRLGAFSREIGLTQDHLDEIRKEMADGPGDDVTR